MTVIKFLLRIKNCFELEFGMTLYIMKHLKPDIANAFHVLSKVMDGANPAAFFNMHHAVNSTLDTMNFGVEPNRAKTK